MVSKHVHVGNQAMCFMGLNQREAGGNLLLRQLDYWVSGYVDTDGIALVFRACGVKSSIKIVKFIHKGEALHRGILLSFGHSTSLC